MSVADLVVEHEEADGRGAFFVAKEGVRLAEMTYTRVDAKHMIVDHTDVHAKLQRLGVARRMLDTLVTWARTTGTRVAATCPYAAAQFAKDASIRDVLDA